MFLASFLHVADDRLRDVIEGHSNVDSRLIHLVPTRSTSLANSMFDVIKRLVNLF